MRWITRPLLPLIVCSAVVLAVRHSSRSDSHLAPEADDASQFQGMGGLFDHTDAGTREGVGLWGASSLWQIFHLADGNSSSSNGTAPVDTAANATRKEAERPPSEYEMENILVIAKKAAILGGNTLTKAQRDHANVEYHQKTNPQDLVSEVDRLVQRKIRGLIKRNFPKHAFLGEEEDFSAAEGSRGALDRRLHERLLWVVDPVDGTVNFLHGFPYSVVSIAVIHKEEPIVGVIYDPSRMELFWAVKGKGTYINNRKQLTVSAKSNFTESLLACGLGTTPHQREPTLRAMIGVAGEAQSVRCMGSASLSLAWVAAGRLDGYWELDMDVWDSAAGSLMVTEAQGTVTDTKGKPYALRSRNVAATTGGVIHDRLLHLLQETVATEPAFDVT
ncbi:unnamed protein product [Vitrella brassicaformis CCMP3155]|uniref:Inositol-1-monophosphatase n=2 Tax=Vitrella brassicaformis TaxID=1169539 RepID=A0A0G4G021_VITBC|nr:unnamed protein product [Vitrella brassicaformis CCMP3155]|eukprot:CEM21161.1 unnamed protein product [Vitrella brassicaformis CCMP3155]